MGSESFFVEQKGIFRDAREAFQEAVENAQYDYGHGGYTGTIAEKRSFRMLECPPRKDPYEFALEQAENSEGKFWDDKWGDAACVEVKGSYLQKERGEQYKGKRNFRVFYFFGWASS